MPIMKKKVYKNFTVVDNYYIDDIECKPECMGYLTYMLRKPENWNFTFKSIMKDLGVGERNVRTNIQKLEALKYIKRERSRDEKGHKEKVSIQKRMLEKCKKKVSKGAKHTYQMSKKISKVIVSTIKGIICGAKSLIGL